MAGWVGSFLGWQCDLQMTCMRNPSKGFVMLLFVAVDLNATDFRATQSFLSSIDLLKRILCLLRAGVD